MHCSSVEEKDFMSEALRCLYFKSAGGLEIIFSTSPAIV